MDFTIIDDPRFRQIYGPGKRRTKPINTEVLHGTGGGNTLEWMINGAPLNPVKLRVQAGAGEDLLIIPPTKGLITGCRVTGPGVLGGTVLQAKNGLDRIQLSKPLNRSGAQEITIHQSYAPLYERNVGSFNYHISLAGIITRIIDEEYYWVHHASCGMRDEQTVGIELENLHPDNQNPYTELQYQALYWLTFEYLMPKYPELTTLASHKRFYEKYSGGTKSCPGASFEWEKLEMEMHARGLSFSHDPAYESYWDIREAA